VEGERGGSADRAAGCGHLRREREPKKRRNGRIFPEFSARGGLGRRAIRRRPDSEVAIFFESFVVMRSSSAGRLDSRVRVATGATMQNCCSKTTALVLPGKELAVVQLGRDAAEGEKVAAERRVLRRRAVRGTCRDGCRRRVPGTGEEQSLGIAASRFRPGSFAWCSGEVGEPNRRNLTAAYAR